MNIREAVELLRKRAEKKVAESPETSDPLSPEATRLALHELRVHQIELEIQNEELRRAQAETDAIRERYFDLYDLAPVGYITLGDKGLILEANLAAVALFGVGRDTLVNRPLFKFALKEEADSYYWFRKQLVETGEPQSCELQMVKGDVTPFWAHLAATAARDVGGEPVCRITLSDITERKRLMKSLHELNASLENRVADRTAELRKAHDELLRRNAQFRALVARLAQTENRERQRIVQYLHNNFQQLLLAAKLKTELIQSRARNHALKESSQQVLDIIGQAIASSRSLTMELAPPVLYDAGFEEALRWLARWMKETYELAVDVSGTLPPAPMSDDLRMQLFDAVRELLINIVKHAKVRKARVTMEPTGDGLLVTVADEGIGFDAAVAPALRRTFGLFSIQERLSLIGGRLDIASSPVSGTAIGLYVPLVAAPLPKAESNPAPGGPPAKALRAPLSRESHIRILVADDHAIVRDGLVQMLGREKGFDIVGQAVDGQDAVEKARALRPDVILMDVTMPRLSGQEATRLISAEMPEIQIIGLSMHVEDDIADQMRAAGAKRYFVKDSPINKIAGAIRELVHAQRKLSGAARGAVKTRAAKGCIPSNVG
jgi:PAS domain S-box-containing protein